ncbi:MAG: GTP-binding protein [Anaeromassilibacillus sp.]
MGDYTVGHARTRGLFQRDGADVAGADHAILVISGTDGVQGHTLTLWHLLKRYRIPTFPFVNKMDLPGADRASVGLQARLDGGCVDFSAESGADF